MSSYDLGGLSRNAISRKQVQSSDSSLQTNAGLYDYLFRCETVIEGWDTESPVKSDPIDTAGPRMSHTNELSDLKLQS